MGDEVKNSATISLCMIVKNEEDFLEQCLESVKALVDEMVIVDTGSTDKTMEIARRYTDKVYFYEWPGSFSAARNHSLQFCTGDWILQLDADEALEQDDIPVVREVIKSNLYNAVSVALLNETPEGWSKHYFQRLYRRGKARYEGIVHNQLVFEGAELRSEIRVYHWGYNLSKDKMAAKFARTKALLLQQIEENPTNAFAHQNYVRILRSGKRYKEAVKAGLEAFDLCRNTMNEVHRQMIACDTAYSMMLSGDVDGAEKLANEILKDYPENLDLLFLLGGISIHRRQFDLAISVFHRFLAVKAKELVRPRHTNLIVDSYSFQHKAWYHIADCQVELGQFGDALASINKALELDSNQPNFYLTQAKILANLQRLPEALKSIDTAKKLTDQIRENFYVLLASLQEKIPGLGDPGLTIQEGLGRFPESEELPNRYAYQFVSLDPAKANALWQRVLEMNPNHLGARLGLVTLAVRQHDPDALKAQLPVLIEKLESANTILEVARQCMALDLFSEAIDMLSSYLRIKPDDVEALSDVATCYAKMGQLEAAVLGYQHVLALQPGNDKAIGNLQVVQRMMEEGP